MKKIIALLLLAALSLQVSFAALSPMKPGVSATTEETAKSRKQLEKLMMDKISKMTIKEYEVIRGKKMNVFERLAFKATQKKLQKQLKKEGSGDSTGFNVGGFLLGLLLGLIGVLLAFVFSKDKNLRKWTLIGWGVWVVIVLLFII